MIYIFMPPEGLVYATIGLIFAVFGFGSVYGLVSFVRNLWKS
ncbi:hypothetical protein BH11ARM2_BH11ARM2_25400 [soil metagenome]